MLTQPAAQSIELWPIERLIEYPGNPRKNDAAVERMCASIRGFGFKIRCLVRSDGEVVDGHLRLKAARKLGITEIPTILLAISLAQVLSACRCDYAAWPPVELCVNMRFSVLHIWDLHRDLTDEGSNTWLLDSLDTHFRQFDSQAPAIQKRALCIVSGDLIYGVRPVATDAEEELRRQYGQAKEFLIGVAERFFGGDRMKVVILAGNHSAKANKTILIARGFLLLRAIIPRSFKSDANIETLRLSHSTSRITPS